MGIGHFLLHFLSACKSQNETEDRIGHSAGLGAGAKVRYIKPSNVLCLVNAEGERADEGDSDASPGHLFQKRATEAKSGSSFAASFTAE